MKLILNEEQNYLKETALSFVSEKTPVSHLRQLRDTDDQLRWDKEIWSEMVKLGWSGILIPEEYGGSNFGLTGMSVILQECGKTLTPSPLFASGVLGATALTKFGSEEQKQKYLSKIASGELTTALAIDENSHHNPNICELKAIKDKIEIRNIEAAHISDGIALTKYLFWVKKNVNKRKITEMSATQKLFQLRKKNKKFKFLSFPTISGSGPNGAIIHYRANKKTDRKLKNGDIYLVDSGGQYEFGTTDVTRTISLNNKNERIKTFYNMEIIKIFIKLIFTE